MPKRKFIDRLADVKTVFQLAQEGLKGIGIPGVEAIAGIPLLILSYFEVNGVLPFGFVLSL